MPTRAFLLDPEVPYNPSCQPAPVPQSSQSVPVRLKARKDPWRPSIRHFLNPSAPCTLCLPHYHLALLARNRLWHLSCPWLPNRQLGLYRPWIPDRQDILDPSVQNNQSGPYRP